MAALLLAGQVVRNAAVHAFVESDPAKAARAWPSHPEAVVALGMSAIGAAAHRGQSVGPEVLRRIYSAAAGAPLAAQPYLVRGVQAQLAGDSSAAERAFQAAEWRDPRSLPARYFLAEYYLRAGDIRRGLTEFAALARLAPNGVVSVTPYLASYARDPSRWPQIRALFRTDPELQNSTLQLLAGDVDNSSAILALADPAHRNAQSPWLPKLLSTLVSDGQFAKARAIWADVAGVRTGSADLLFDAGFAAAAPPPPFNWSLTSSTVGLAERQSGGRLHVIYYGQEDGALASQLLILPPGRYRLAMRIAGGGSQAASLRWSLVCASAQGPLASARLDTLVARPLIFEVPAGCAAQKLELSGSSSDIPRQVEVTISDLTLVKAGANG
ncbi:tetratricopeptide repeat protein [Sphingomonas sp. URHD0057]|uniref:tetratricopeptide repeat protein n=1 Tax=Sphingomonas sp. URHD0057 TaxID=1380389 RepID=UPI000491DE2B|nr:hypothetical protein [Sphingomonas sp. URHD0057]